MFRDSRPRPDLFVDQLINCSSSANPCSSVTAGHVLVHVHVPDQSCSPPPCLSRVLTDVKRAQHHSTRTHKVRSNKFSITRYRRSPYEVSSKHLKSPTCSSGMCSGRIPQQSQTGVLCICISNAGNRVLLHTIVASTSLPV